MDSLFWCFFVRRVQMQLQITFRDAGATSQQPQLRKVMPARLMIGEGSFPSGKGTGGSVTYSTAMDVHRRVGGRWARTSPEMQRSVWQWQCSVIGEGLRVVARHGIGEVKMG